MAEESDRRGDSRRQIRQRQDPAHLRRRRGRRQHGPRRQAGGQSLPAGDRHGHGDHAGDPQHQVVPRALRRRRRHEGTSPSNPARWASWASSAWGSPPSPSTPAPSEQGLRAVLGDEGRGGHQRPARAERGRQGGRARSHGLRLPGGGLEGQEHPLHHGRASVRPRSGPPSTTRSSTGPTTRTSPSSTAPAPRSISPTSTTSWSGRPATDIDAVITVDREFPGWDGRVGFVPAVLEEMAPKPDNTIAITCGPPIMIKFVLQSLQKLQFADEQIYTTLEKRMKCGIGICGRCNIGPDVRVRGRPCLHHGRAAGVARRDVGAANGADHMPRQPAALRSAGGSRT